MSFLLIRWYSAREKASFSAKKAIIYNRFADFFFLFLICLEIFENNSLFWGEVFINKDEISNSLFFSQFKYLVIFRFLFRIMGKSAQFCFHP
jgi:NADH:ubiquinone oxidoreductase subunit 5 (subunit L)/multisubunit Na+/H+ antiporter MnhA subunit